MATAAIRHAARRIGGALQRAAERPTRLFDTKELTADEKKDAAIRIIVIDQKTEHLYNLISELRAKYTVTGSKGRKYNSLLSQLSVQIQPRCDDPTWRSCRRSARTQNFFNHVGQAFIGYVVGDASYHWYKGTTNP